MHKACIFGIDMTSSESPGYLGKAAYGGNIEACKKFIERARLRNQLKAELDQVKIIIGILKVL